ncbi:MAG: hypothetical protein HOP19_13105, partial [Acidobacteria bacterium]|nr:hypothetical protein [Acidobacteriota bacterium]
FYGADPMTLATSLGGVSVTVNGQPALLQFSSPIQISILVARNTPLGAAEVIVTNADGRKARGTMEVVSYAPGIYTATLKGQGTPGGYATFDNEHFEPLSNADGTGHPIEAGTAERSNQITIFATAIRGVPTENPNDENGVAEAVKIFVQGLPARVLYAGPVPGIAGIDQIRFVLPPQVAGLTSATLRTVVGEKSANFLKLQIVPRVVPEAFAELEPEVENVGYLTTQDRRMTGDNGSGQSYFFDGYRMYLPADTNVAVELYSVQFDAAAILYRRMPDGSLAYVAADDQTYGMDETRDLNHALLLTRVAEAGEYVLCVTSAAADPGGTGRYTMRWRSQGYQVQPIFYGATIGGVFTNKDIRTGGGNTLDAFTFTGHAGDVVKVQVSGTNFDPFIILNRNNGDYVTEDDNSGGGKNAELIVTLPATGRYMLYVTPYETWRGGNYTLKLTSQGTAAVTDELKTEAAVAGRYWGGNSRTLNSTHFAARRMVPE